MNEPRFVLDINVLIPAMIGKESSFEKRLYQCSRRRECIFVTSEELFDELQRVVDYPNIIKLGITPAIAASMVFNLLHLGEYHSVVKKLEWPTLNDKKDWYLLDLLYHSQADALFTRDKAVLKVGKLLDMPTFHPKDLQQSNWFNSLSSNSSKAN